MEASTYKEIVGIYAAVLYEYAVPSCQYRTWKAGITGRWLRMSKGEVHAVIISSAAYNGAYKDSAINTVPNIDAYWMQGDVTKLVGSVVCIRRTSKIVKGATVMCYWEVVEDGSE